MDVFVKDEITRGGLLDDRVVGRHQASKPDPIRASVSTAE
jgi:hypothetical protein